MSNSGIVVTPQGFLKRTPLPNKNLIIAGHFTTNPFQRGTGGTNYATGGVFKYCADRWFLQKDNTADITVTPVADYPDPGVTGINCTQCLRVGVNTADTSVAAGDFIQLVQVVEGYRARQVYQKSFTISFWVKATKTGIYCGFARNSAGDRTFLFEYTIATSNVWQKVIVQVPPHVGGTWSFSSSGGIAIGFTLMAGSTWQGSLGWTNTNKMGTANQVNWADTAANLFYLDQVQVTPGVIAVPYLDQPYEEVLRECHRYYRRINCLDNFGRFGQGNSYSGTTANIFVPIPTPMRAKPTLTAGGAIQAEAAAGVTASVTAVSLNQWSEAGAVVDATLGTSITAGQSVGLFAGNTSGAYLAFECEL